jgi:uncharacterized membrane protein YedE/YeeE
MNNRLSWFKGGILLGLVILLAVVIVKPIGVSTQFVILDAIVWDAFAPDTIVENAENAKGFGSENAYLNKGGGKYAANAANPLNYSFVFVIAMIAGSGLSAFFGGDKPQKSQKSMPDVWRDKFGGSPVKRYVAVFFAGFLVLFGARLAGGCTSGHMMSGGMQTSLSAYLFILGTFAAAIPVAIFAFGGAKLGAKS